VNPSANKSVKKLGLLLVALVSGCATWAQTGSVYRGPCTHFGARPALDGLDGAAFTVQVTTDWPRCAGHPHPR
jgi:hypothetical protein